MGSKVKNLRQKLKSYIAQHGREMARLQETYSKAGRSAQSDPSYNSLARSKSSLESRLKNLDGRIEDAMIRKVTGDAAERLIWREDDLREVDSLYRNSGNPVSKH